VVCKERKMLSVIMAIGSYFTSIILLLCLVSAMNINMQQILLYKAAL